MPSLVIEPRRARSRRVRGGAGAALSRSGGWSGRSFSSITWGRWISRRAFRARVDVRPHPHIGLSTVTYLFEGEIMHRDSVGSEQAIRPGEVNWMTAGRGITHSERFEAARRSGGPHARHPGLGGAAEGGRGDASRHSPIMARRTCRPMRARRLWARLIAGEAFGAKAAVKTHSPLFYVHWRLQPGAKARAAGRSIRSARPMSSRASVEVEGRVYDAGQMLVFPAGRR